MQTVNIHEAKTHLSELIEQAAKGTPFIIAKEGKPMVKVVPLNTPETRQRKRKRLGFMVGQITVPDDFDTMDNTVDIDNDHISKIMNDPAKVTQIIQAGIKAALLKHKQAGNPICEWRDGKIVWIPAEEIPV